MCDVTCCAVWCNTACRLLPSYWRDTIRLLEDLCKNRGSALSWDVHHGTYRVIKIPNLKLGNKEGTEHSDQAWVLASTQFIEIFHSSLLLSSGRLGCNLLVSFPSARMVKRGKAVHMQHRDTTLGTATLYRTVALISGVGCRALSCNTITMPHFSCLSYCSTPLILLLLKRDLFPSSCFFWVALYTTSQISTICCQDRIGSRERSMEETMNAFHLYRTARHICSTMYSRRAITLSYALYDWI